MTLPSSVAEFANLQAIIGEYLGAGASSWDSDDTARIQRVIDSGYELYRLGGGHRWSWLYPIRSITTAADQYAYDLPEEFGGIIGPLTWSAENGNSRFELPVIGESQIRIMRQGNVSTGRPTYCAYRPKQHSSTTGQRFELIFAVTPDAEYTFEFCMAVLCPPLSATNKYPVGGPMYSQLLIAACLSVAESRYKRAETQKREEFNAALAAAVAQDSAEAPDTVGQYGADGANDQFATNRRNYTGERYYFNDVLTG